MARRVGWKKKESTESVVNFSTATSYFIIRNIERKNEKDDGWVFN